MSTSDKLYISGESLVGVILILLIVLVIVKYGNSCCCKKDQTSQDLVTEETTYDRDMMLNERASIVLGQAADDDTTITY